jgi:outer membrane protein assembly factor BamB
MLEPVRRAIRVVVGGACLSLLLALPAPSASAEPSADPAGSSLHRCTDPPGTITDLGPASVTNAPGNGEFIGDKMYAVTRGLSPNVVGVYDLATDRVTTHYEIPTGIGAWATATIGTDLYVGTHIPSDLYKVDTVSGAVTKLASFDDDYIWNLAASPDGKIYLGLSQSGRVVEYDPATGATRDLGVASPGEQYARSIAADATTVYVGVGSHAHLVAIDRATGAKREILPAELASRDFVASMAASDTHLAMGISSAGELLVMEKANPANYQIVKASVPGEKYVTTEVIDGDDIFFAGRPSGTLYRYNMTSRKLDVLGVPYPEAGTARLLAHGGKIYGLQDGAVFVYDKATGALEYRNLVQRGFRAAPEQPMTMFADGRRVYVSGKGGVQIHDLATGQQSRLGLPGEPKAMAAVDGRIYMGVYTQALLYGYPPGAEAAELLARVGNEQDRPRDMAYDERGGLLVMPTQPEPGHPNGALSIYDIAGRKLDVYRPVIDRQSVYSVTVDKGVAYLGSYIQEGFGLPPVARQATLAAFDLNERRVLWQLDPVPGATFIADLVHLRNRVYGVTDNGVFFEVDPVHRKVLRTVRVGAAGGDLVVKGQAIYGTDGNRVYQVNPRTLKVTTVVDGLAGAWFDGAKLADDPAGCGLYTLRDRNLIRVVVSGRP